MNALHKIKEILMKLTGYLSVLLFAFMTVIGTYQIVTRYVFNRPSTVSEGRRSRPGRHWQTMRCRACGV